MFRGGGGRGQGDMASSFMLAIGPFLLYDQRVVVCVDGWMVGILVLAVCDNARRMTDRLGRTRTGRCPSPSPPIQTRFLNVTLKLWALKQFAQPINGSHASWTLLKCVCGLVSKIHYLVLVNSDEFWIVFPCLFFSSSSFFNSRNTFYYFNKNKNFTWTIITFI